MRLLYVTVAMPYSHKEPFLIEEALCLQRLVDKLIIVPRSPGPHCYNNDAVPLLKDTLRQPLVSFQVLFGALATFLSSPIATIKAVRSVLVKQPPSHLLKNLAVVPKALWIAKIVKKQRIDHIHCHWALSTATMAMIASRATGVPWSLTCHRGDIADNNLLALKISSAFFTRFISQNGLEMASALLAKSNMERCYVGRLGVKMPKTVKGFTGGRPLFVCPANLLPVKGHQYLFQAVCTVLKKGLDLQLYVAGTGPLEFVLRQLATDLGIENSVIFAGQVPHDQLLKLYREGKAFAVVLPSVDLGNNVREGVPVSLIEALAYGVPVISTSTGGIPELVEGAGILVKDKSASELASAIETLITKPDYRQSLVAKGLEKVRDEYDIEKNTAQLVAKMSQPWS